MNKTVVYVGLIAVVVLVVWYVSKSKNVTVTGGGNLGITAGNNQPPPGSAPTPGLTGAYPFGLPGSAGGVGDSWSGQQAGAFAAGLGQGIGSLFSGIGGLIGGINSGNQSPQAYNGGGNSTYGYGGVDYSPASNFDQGAYEVNQEEFWDAGFVGPVAG